MDRGDEVRAPATTRLGPSGGSERRLRLAVGLVAVAVALAVLKPWGLLAGPPVPTADTSSSAAPSSAGPSAGPGATPRAAAWIVIDDRPACFGSRTWMAVVDEIDGGRLARSWTSLVPVPASGPTDPAITRTHAYADAVPRLGFCTPAPAAADAAAAAGQALDVDLWRLEPGGGGAPDAGARDVAWRLVGGGTGAEGGALYVPAGEPHLRRATLGSRGWPPGTYVFRVRVGAAPGATDEAWFAVELRGPWRGPGAGAPDPSPPDPGAPSPAPDG